MKKENEDEYYFIFSGTDKFVKEYCKSKIKTSDEYMLKVDKCSRAGNIILRLNTVLKKKGD